MSLISWGGEFETQWSQFLFFGQIWSKPAIVQCDAWHILLDVRGPYHSFARMGPFTNYVCNFSRFLTTHPPKSLLFCTRKFAIFKDSGAPTYSRVPNKCTGCFISYCKTIPPFLSMYLISAELLYVYLELSIRNSLWDWKSFQPFCVKPNLVCMYFKKSL